MKSHTRDPPVQILEAATSDDSEIRNHQCGCSRCIQKIPGTDYWEMIRYGVDNDSAGCAPAGMEEYSLIGATPYQWKHMIRQRTCRRNTKGNQICDAENLGTASGAEQGTVFRTVDHFCMNGGCRKEI